MKYLDRKIRSGTIACLLLLSVITTLPSMAFSPSNPEVVAQWMREEIVGIWNLPDSKGVLVQRSGPESEGKHALEFAVIDFTGKVAGHHLSYHDRPVKFQRFEKDGGFVFRQTYRANTTVLGEEIKAFYAIDLPFDSTGKALPAGKPHHVRGIIPWPPSSQGAFDLVAIAEDGSTSSFREAAGFSFNPILLDIPGFDIPQGPSEEEVHLIAVRSAEEPPVLSRIERAELIAWFPYEDRAVTLFDGRMVVLPKFGLSYLYDSETDSITLLRPAEKQPEGLIKHDSRGRWKNVSLSESSSLPMLSDRDDLINELVRFELTTGESDVLASGRIPRLRHFKDKVLFFQNYPDSGMATLHYVQGDSLGQILSIQGEIFNVSLNVMGWADIVYRGKPRAEWSCLRYHFNCGAFETGPSYDDRWSGEAMLPSEAKRRLGRYNPRFYEEKTVLGLDIDDQGRGWSHVFDENTVTNYIGEDYLLLCGFDEPPLSIKSILREIDGYPAH